MTLCIGQQHPIILYRTGFGVCVVLVLSVIWCLCYYFLDRILFHHDFHHDSCECHWDFYGHSLHCELHFRLSVTKYFWFCKCTTPWMFPPLDILPVYWIVHVTFGLLYVMFTFLAMIFCMGVPGFVTDYSCGVWCRGLTPCLLYVGPLFGNLFENDSRFVIHVWHTEKQLVCCSWLFYILMSRNMMILYFRLPYFHVSNTVLFST